MYTTDKGIAEEDTLGGRISTARESCRLSVGDAAKGLGVQTSSWKAWETDRTVPRSNRLTMMAGLLGVSPSWLLIGRGTGPIDRPSPEMTTLLQKLEAATIDATAAQSRVQELVGQVKALGFQLAGEQAVPG